MKIVFILMKSCFFFENDSAHSVKECIESGVGKYYARTKLRQWICFENLQSKLSQVAIYVVLCVQQANFAPLRDNSFNFVSCTHFFSHYAFCFLFFFSALETNRKKTARREQEISVACPTQKCCTEYCLDNFLSCCLYPPTE